VDAIFESMDQQAIIDAIKQIEFVKVMPPNYATKSNVRYIYNEWKESFEGLTKIIRELGRLHGEDVINRDIIYTFYDKISKIAKGILKYFPTKGEERQAGVNLRTKIDELRTKTKDDIVALTGEVKDMSPTSGVSGVQGGGRRKRTRHVKRRTRRVKTRKRLLPKTRRNKRKNKQSKKRSKRSKSRR